MLRTLVVGNNFSGRSAALRNELQRRREPAFFLGPYAEAALSGLSSTVADEIAIYARACEYDSFASIDWARFGNRKPTTPAGGRQGAPAPAGCLPLRFPGVRNGTRAEELGGPDRAAALAYLSAPYAFDAILIDNRLEHVPGWQRRDALATTPAHRCDLAGLLPELRPCAAPAITIRAMDFGYEPGRPIFRSEEHTSELQSLRHL